MTGRHSNAMLTGRRTYRSKRRPGVPAGGRISAARIAVALLPLPALLPPVAARADTGVEIAICSGGGARTVTIPVRKSPSPRDGDQQACAHLVCPRERGQGEPVGDEEE
ncbi:MAG TPA: hypothetical protein VI168_08185 [Croceibacterium sp.]